MIIYNIPFKINHKKIIHIELWIYFSRVRINVSVLKFRTLFSFCSQIQH